MNVVRTFFAELRGCGTIDMCIVIDSSGSIRDSNPDDDSYDNWEFVLEFVKEVNGIYFL